MNPGTVIRIPDAVASRTAGRETIQPGLPGKWSIWSQSADGPGAHFAIPLDDSDRQTGIKVATVRIKQPKGDTALIQLLATDPMTAMPKTKTSRA